jgi:hypothetical protein
MSRSERCRVALEASLPQLHEDILGTVTRTVRTLHRTPSGPLAAKVSHKGWTDESDPVTAMLTRRRYVDNSFPHSGQDSLDNPCKS